MIDTAERQDAGSSASSRQKYATAEIEFAEALNAVQCAAARARVIENAGIDVLRNEIGYSVFAGHGTHLTQTSGFGVRSGLAEDAFEAVDRFYRIHNADAMLHLANNSVDVQQLLRRCGYEYVGDTAVVALALGPAHTLSTALEVVDAGECGEHAWLQTVTQGWQDVCSVDSAQECAKTVAAMPHAMRFLARRKSGEYCGAAAVSVFGPVAVLFCDCALSAHRGIGVQKALIQARLNAARDARCNIATATVPVDSASLQNYLNCGFLLHHKRRTWTKPATNL